MSRTLVVRRAEPTEQVARDVLRAYVDEVASRWYGRRATAAEVDEALRDDPSDDLVPPSGLLLVASFGTDGLDGSDSAEGPADRVALGCGGLRLLPGGVAEVKRVFVRPEHRGRGVATALVDALEQHARALGATTARLDTRHDLVEALALYERRGYRDVPAFNTGPYAQRWLGKDL